MIQGAHQLTARPLADPSHNVITLHRRSFLGAHSCRPTLKIFLCEGRGQESQKRQHKTMVICWKCAEDHEEPSGHLCTRKGSDARGIRAEKRLAEGSSAMASSKVAEIIEQELLEDVQQDEEEKALRAELLEQQRQQRKLYLKAKIEQMKVQNAALEAGETIPDPKEKTPPEETPAKDVTPPGPKVQQTPAPRPPTEKESKYSIARFLPKREDIRKANFQELIFGSLEWAIHTELDPALKGYLQHLGYMCMMSESGIYPPDAYRPGATTVLLIHTKVVDWPMAPVQRPPRPVKRRRRRVITRRRRL